MGIKEYFLGLSASDLNIVVYVCLVFLALILLSFILPVFKGKKKAPKSGAYYCSECHHILSDVDRIYSNGRCPYCETKKRGAGSIVSSYQK